MDNILTKFCNAAWQAVSAPVRAFQKPPQAPQSMSGTENSVSSGLLKCGKEKFDNVKANGRVTLDGTLVIGELKVNGSLSCQNAFVNTLSVTGYAFLNNTKIGGNADISGIFSAEHCTFSGDLSVKEHKVVLKDCTTGSIHIKKVMWPFDSQVVELVDGSICTGDIVFESGKGRVILRDGSVLEGHVVGGDSEEEIRLKAK